MSATADNRKWIRRGDFGIGMAISGTGGKPFNPCIIVAAFSLSQIAALWIVAASTARVVISRALFVPARSAVAVQRSALVVP